MLGERFIKFVAKEFLSDESLPFEPIVDPLVLPPHEPMAGARGLRFPMLGAFTHLREGIVIKPVESSRLRRRSSAMLIKQVPITPVQSADQISGKHGSTNKSSCLSTRNHLGACCSGITKEDLGYIGCSQLDQAH